MNKKIAGNIVFSLIYQVLMIAVGFLLPRAILTHYGVSVHGVISTINNIMNYIMLLNAGLATASMQSLYKPLGENDRRTVSVVYKAIEHSYRITSLWFLIAVVSASIALPIFVKGEVSSPLVFLMVIVVGMQYVLENLLMYSSRILVQADNRTYIVSIIDSISFSLRGLLQLLMIYLGFPVWAVLLVPAVLVLFRTALIRIVIKKHFDYIDHNVPYDKTILQKRKYAVMHQISALVLNNTDVILLTIFWNQKVISKYSVYAMVFSHLYLLLTFLCNTSVVAHIGKSILTKSIEVKRDYFDKYELVHTIIVSVLYSVTGCMILDFVRLYTSGISEIKYVDGTVGLLFLIYGILYALRIPSYTYIDAAGMYKETQHLALIEVIINLGVSIILCKSLGIVGVLIGTVCAFMYRTTASILFANKAILKTSPAKSLLRMALTGVTAAATVLCFAFLIHIDVDSWLMWVVKAIAAFGAALVFTCAVFMPFYGKTMIGLIKDLIKKVTAMLAARKKAHS